jgi:hypothetical protein
MKGQIGIIVVAVMLIVGMLMLLLSAYVVSEESLTRESVAQTQVSLTEFKSLTAMNAILKNQSIKEYVRSSESDNIEDEEEEIRSIFERNNGETDDREYYFSIEDKELSIGEEPVVVKSVYLASPSGPKRMEVGAKK